MEIHSMLAKPRDTELEYKCYKLVREPTYNLWEIHMLDGSDLPLALISKFTTRELATAFIDRYEANANDRDIAYR